MKVKLPQSVIKGLRIGLELYTKGLGGKGLVDETLRMARTGVRTGEWDEWKVVKASNWFARHVADRTRMTNPKSWNQAPRYSPAYVAWALWGDDGTNSGKRWIDKKAKELKAQGVKASPRKNPSREYSSLPLLKGSDGQPLRLYKGTSYTGALTPDARSANDMLSHEYAIYLTPRRGYAQTWARSTGGRLREFTARARKPLFVEGKYEISPRDLTKQDVNRLLRQGYDAIVVTDSNIDRASEVILFDSDQITEPRKNPQNKKGMSKTTDYHRAGAAAWSELGFFPLGHPDGLSTLWLAMYGSPLPKGGPNDLSRAWRKAGSKEMIAALRDLRNGAVLPRTKGVRLHHSILKGDSHEIIDSIIRSGLRADPKGVGRYSEAPDLTFFSAGTYHSRNAPVLTFDIPPSWEGWSNAVGVDYNRSKGTLDRRPSEGNVVAVSASVPAKFLVAVNGIPLSEYRKASPRKNPSRLTESYTDRERNRLAKLEGNIPLWSSFRGKMLPIAQLMEEELDRGNTTKEELARWLEKYGLTPESPATWVTTNPFYAAGYENEMRPPDVDSYIEEQGEDAFEEEFEVSWTAKHPTFTKQGGVLVVESHDGDDGYLFASPRKNPPRTQSYKYGVPKKYLQGLPDKVARERATEIIRRREEGIKTSSSLPGDKLTRKKTMRGSKWTQMYKQKYGANSGTTRSVVARDTGIPASIINEVYKRGVGASRTSGHRPGANDSSWALARVHAFVMKVLHEKGPINQDPDLARKVMARKNPVLKSPGVSDAEVRRLGESYLKGRDILSTRQGKDMARAAAEKVHSEFEKVRKKVKVIFTERDPYPDFEALRADVTNNNRMYIYTGYSVTPLWDEQTNWKARAVHDFDHVKEGAGFGLHGEFMAFRASAKKAPQLSDLYMSEIPLQAAAYHLKGDFPEGPQKVVPINPELKRLVNRLGMRQNPSKRRNRNRMANLALEAQTLGKFMPPEDVAMHLGAWRGDAPIEEVVLASISSIGRKKSRNNPPFKTPPYMRRCVVHLVEDGHDLNAAFAICNASMQDAGHLTGGNGQKETKSGKRKRRADRGEKDQAAFDAAYEEILAVSRARNNPKLRLMDYGDEVIEVVDADRIGKGMFKTVFKSKKPRKDGQDVVAITSDGSFDHEILSYACDRSPKSRHIPCTKFVGYIDDQRVYTMQLYKSPLRKTDSPKAWEQYKMLKEASEKAARKHRSRNPDMALDEYRATIENYKKMPGHSKAIARALDYIEDASANYGTSFLWEFTPRNLATDKSGNLILLDAFFDVRQAMKIRDARMKKARGW